MAVASENKKLFNLSPQVVRELNKERNQSALVDALLIKYYDIDLEDGPAHLRERLDILEGLKYEVDEPEIDPESVTVQPLPDGKPLDGVQGPKINVLGRPAVQDDQTGEFQEVCDECGKPKIGGFCPVHDL